MCWWHHSYPPWMTLTIFDGTGIGYFIICILSGVQEYEGNTILHDLPILMIFYHSWSNLLMSDHGSFFTMDHKLIWLKCLHMSYKAGFLYQMNIIVHMITTGVVNLRFRNINKICFSVNPNNNTHMLWCVVAWYCPVLPVSFWTISLVLG